MKQIILKLLLALSPLLILTVVYIYNDPFKTLYHYDAYYPTDGIQYVNLNNDYTATQNFINHNAEYHYDSYIFGNSRGLVFHINEWQKHLPKSSCYQFSVSNESLYGIYCKLQLLERDSVVIKNALLVIDPSLYQTTTENENFPKHPALTGKSKLWFAFKSYTGFFDPDFLVQYLHFLMTKKIRASYFADVLNQEKIHYDPRSNDLVYTEIDTRINKDTGTYYQARKTIFYNRDTTQRYAERAINTDQLILLNSIKKILAKNNTKYKIVISPLYNQLRTDTTDMKMLCSVFSKENIYDLSGINDITACKYNYYENAHYRPFVANRIMDSIYGIVP